MDLSTREGRREQGKRLQRAVERAGLTVEELANRIGCSRALIYQYLSGSTLAQPDRLQQIAEVCGVPLTYFYADTAEEPQESPESATEPIATRLTESLRNLQELAAAQSSPPDQRAYVLTCERIVSLTEQLGDKAAQARAQEQLGNALLACGENLRAADALARAVSLAVELGDNAAELAARQSLGKALWGLGRIEEARAQFTTVANSNNPSSKWRGLLALGSLHEQFGEFAEAMRLFEEANGVLDALEQGDEAAQKEARIGRLYVNTNQRNVYMACGDFVNARALAETCLFDAEQQGNADQHLEARFDLAWIDFATGRWRDAYLGWIGALRLARFLGDQRRETLSRAWLGLFFAAAGDFNAAIQHGKDALAQALSRGDRQAELYAQLALTDAYTGLPGRLGEARYHIAQALAIASATNYAGSDIECRLRLTRLHILEGHGHTAKEAAAAAIAAAAKLGARHLEALAHLRFAEALHRENGSSNSLAEMRQHAERALALAQETGYTEASWRAHHLLALWGLRLTAPDIQTAQAHWDEALQTLNLLRSSLQQAELPDTLLENPECLAVYEAYARLLERYKGKEALNAFLEQTSWPPLLDRLERSER